MNNLNRSICVILAFACSIVWVILGKLIFSPYYAKILFDYTDNTIELTQFFTIQNLMWVIFFFGLSEIIYRYLFSLQENKQLDVNYLPEDDETILVKDDLKEIYYQANLAPKHLFVPRLLRRIILQVQISNSIDRANTILNSSVELLLHEIDLRYNMLRYIMWFIPTLGFIGTVIGISRALEIAGNTPQGAEINLNEITGMLGVAFYTTLLALVMSGILVFLMQIVQAKEENALNLSSQYCMDGLINRLLIN